jgi:hypothetical protein
MAVAGQFRVKDFDIVRGEVEGGAAGLFELGGVVAVATLLDVGEFVIAELFTFERGVTSPEGVVEVEDEVGEITVQEWSEELGVGPLQELAFVGFAGDLGRDGDDGASGGTAVGEGAVGEDTAEGMATDVGEGWFVSDEGLDEVLGSVGKREGVGDVLHAGGGR